MSNGIGHHWIQAVINYTSMHATLLALAVAYILAQTEIEWSRNIVQFRPTNSGPLATWRQSLTC